MKYLFLAVVLLLAACAPASTVLPTQAAPPVISVHASPATEPWLGEVYVCGAEISVVIRLSASESAADIRLRLGEPEILNTPAYPIGAEELLVVAHRESLIQNLSREEARELFSHGRENVELWVFASSVDAQEIFEREVMLGERIHPLARLALHPQQMSDILNSDSNAVGILPRRWMAGAAREVFRLAEIPVLAMTPIEPQGAVKELVACLQK